MSRDNLRQTVLDLVKGVEEELSISQVEEKLREKNVAFRRDELRSVVWRLAAGQLVKITADSRIVAVETNPTAVT